MKKSLIALAALAAAGVASAQSSVTLWGVVDAGYQYAKQGNQKRLMMTTSGLSSSQLGFRGVEDLGGGMAAGFWLETSLQNDSGNANGGTFGFGRRSTVSLAGTFGEIRLGRDYTPTFWNHTVYDPFGTLGSGAGSNITLGASNGNTVSSAAFGNAMSVPGFAVARVSNGASYLYGIPKNGASAGGPGFFLQATHAIGENSGNRYTGLRVGFNDAAWSAAVAASNGRAYGAGVFNNFREMNAGASFDMGFMKLMGKLGAQRMDNSGSWKWASLGATIPVGSGYIPVSFNTGKQSGGLAAVDGAASSQFAVGYVHNLSKRTSLYGTGSFIRNNSKGYATFSGGNGGYNPGFVGTGANGTAVDFGLKHSF